MICSPMQASNLGSLTDKTPWRCFVWLPFPSSSPARPVPLGPGLAGFNLGGARHDPRAVRHPKRRTPPRCCGRVGVPGWSSCPFVSQSPGPRNDRGTRRSRRTRRAHKALAHVRRTKTLIYLYLAVRRIQLPRHRVRVPRFDGLAEPSEPQRAAAPVQRSQTRLAAVRGFPVRSD